MVRRQLVGGTASAAISQGYLAPGGLEIVRVVEDNDAYTRAPSRISRARGKGGGPMVVVVAVAVHPLNKSISSLRVRSMHALEPSAIEVQISRRE